MQLVAADLLEDACGLSPGLAVTALLVGGLLWLFGWRSHRFWVVLAATVLAGIYGLMQAPALRAPALPSAVMLALAAGLLALALVRVLAFVAAGLAMVLLAGEFWPGLNQPALIFLSSGLLCLCLFRLCLAALTGAAGALLMTYATLMLLQKYAGLDVVAWSTRATTVLNVAVAALAVCGFALQVYFHRRRQRDQGNEEGGAWVLRLPRVWSWVGGAERDAA